MTVHKATPSSPDNHADQPCAICGQRIKRVPGGQGATWVHRDTGAVGAASPPVPMDDELDALVTLIGDASRGGCFAHEECRAIVQKHRRDAARRWFLDRSSI